MSVPQPPVPLKDPCTIIYNNKLYSYQPDGFQSLDLQDGGTWSQLPMGVATTGSTCLQGSVDDKPAFIVVGGTTVSTSQGYQGVQHFDLASNQWKTDTPADGVAQNRQHHGTAFLQQSSQILMYAGSQDNNQIPSTQTFLISTKSPYTVLAMESKGAPPVEDPLMMAFNASHALMLGGDPTNSKIYLFGLSGGWQQLHATVPNGLKDSSKMQATLLTTTDGSKLLEVFDMSVSPNQISNVLIYNATTSTHPSRSRRSYVSSQHHTARRRTRQINLSNRPAYNDSGAPQDTRSGFSLSSDSSTGLVVAAGGNSQQPIVMFNQTGNQWIDPGAFLGFQPTPSASPSSTSASSTSTGAPSVSPTTPAETSAAAVADNNAKHKSLRVLGGVLGSVFGAAVLFVIALLLLRFCRRRREREYRRRKSEYTLDTADDPMDFRDIGAEFMKEAGGSMTALPASNHTRKYSDRSVDPRTIDRGMTASSESKRGLLHAKGDSAGSGKTFWSRETKSPEIVNKSPPQISAPVLGPPLSRPLLEVPEPRAETGWSRYFTHNNSRETLPPPMPSSHTPSNRAENYLNNTTLNSPTNTDLYRLSPSHLHESAEVAPLSFSQFASPTRTNPQQPSTAHASGLGLAISQGRLVEPNREYEPGSPSMVSDMSHDDDSDLHLHFSHVTGEESSGHDSWTPVQTGGARGSTWTDDRPLSSVTHHTIPLPSRPAEKVDIPNFPMPNSRHTSVAPSPINPLSPSLSERRYSFDNEHPPPPQQPQQQPDRGLRNLASRDIVRTQSGRQTATPDIRTGTQRVVPGLEAASINEVRTFPRPLRDGDVDGGLSRTRGGPETEDMSWLNLGAGSGSGSGSGAGPGAEQAELQRLPSSNHGFYGNGW